MRVRKKRNSWEETCNRCGLCCYIKEYRGGRVTINLNRPCPYLDVESKLCIVYENRLKVCRDCGKVTLLRALFSTQLPRSCGYVQRYRKAKFLVPAPKIHDRRTAGK